MITVAEADRILGDFQLPRPLAEVPLDVCDGGVLAEPIVADRDQPPFDRVCMDGYALRMADWENGSRAFGIRGVAPAGRPPHPPPGEGECVEVMTGAPLPESCDAVVAIERVVRSGDEIRFPGEELRRGGNIHTRGSDYRGGSIVLQPGMHLGPCEVAVLASVGRTRVRVRMAARVAVISTGDEVVPVEAAPAAHQIRGSNAWAVAAALRRRGLGTPALAHLPDDRAALRAGIERALAQCDCLVLSGGVSAGRWDLVPNVLEELGVERLFHKIAQRPGKPLWVGRGPAGQLVAGLPGNPVSALVCFIRHIIPVLERAGDGTPVPRWIRLDAPVMAWRGMTRFVAVHACDGLARLVTGNGSGDFHALAGTDGFVEISPRGEDAAGGDGRGGDACHPGGIELGAGAEFRFHPWR